MTDLSDLYRDHIAVEEREVFPVATAVLERPPHEAMGVEMAARRGLRLGWWLPQSGIGSQQLGPLPQPDGGKACWPQLIAAWTTLRAAYPVSVRFATQ